MSEPVSILVVDDDPAAAAMLQEQLQDDGYVVDAVTSGKAALARAKEQAYALIVSDIEMPDLRGVDLLREILVARPQQLVLLVTAFGSIDLAVACVKNGACDFITKPYRSEVMSHAVARALRERHLRKEVVRLRGLVDSAADDGLVDGLVARSPVMQRLLSLAQRAAMSDAPVLITGESGTGKTRLARFIHEQGRRKSAAFVPVNCAALPPTLAESELFGVRKGAFTGADSDRAGLFVEADGGTIFLDEVGELPWDVQPKLLHALENGTLRAVGAQRGKGDAHVDVRVIAATNRSLEDALKTQRFRPDLYFRLNVIRIEVPPLRERRD
ncbi:MAG TPA: sigma-54 dependent transcriptional regulator, partial [Myxococcota bacterium]